MEGLGRVSEAPGPYFSRFLHACEAAMRKNAGIAKTTIFPRFFIGFQHIARVAHKRKTAKNRSRSLSKGTSHDKHAKILSWASLASILEGFRVVLDDSWAPLGSLLGAPGRLLGALGHLLGPSWASLGCSWAPLGCQMLPKTRSGSILSRFWCLPGPPWRTPGRFFLRFFRTHPSFT